MAENDKATPRGFDNPDAAEFTRRHARFYEALERKDEPGARMAFRSLRSWAYPRCRKDHDFTAIYAEVDEHEDQVSLATLDKCATIMKCAWQDQGLWDWNSDEIEELKLPGPSKPTHQ